MPGDVWQKYATLRTLYGYMYGAPRQEAAVHGRRVRPVARVEPRSTASTGICSTIPPHAALRRYVQALNWHYRAEPALHQVDFDPSGFRWIDCNDNENSVMSLVRYARDPQRLRRDGVQLHAGAAPRLSHRRARAGLLRRAASTATARSSAAATSATAVASTREPIPTHGFDQSLRLIVPAARVSAPEERPRNTHVAPAEPKHPTKHDGHCVDWFVRPDASRAVAVALVTCGDLHRSRRVLDRGAGAAGSQPAARRVADDDRPAVRVVRGDAARRVDPDGRRLGSHRPASCRWSPAWPRSPPRRCSLPFADEPAVALRRAAGAGRGRRGDVGRRVRAHRGPLRAGRSGDASWASSCRARASGSWSGRRIGGWLYETGGIRLPFISWCRRWRSSAVGLLWLRLPRPHTRPRGGADRAIILRAPAVASCALVVVVRASTISMLEPVLLALSGASLQLGPARIGLVFGIAAVASTLLHPVFGRLADRWADGRLTTDWLVLPADRSAPAELQPGFRIGGGAVRPAPAIAGRSSSRRRSRSWRRRCSARVFDRSASPYGIYNLAWGTRPARRTSARRASSSKATGSSRGSRCSGAPAVIVMTALACAGEWAREGEQDARAGVHACRLFAARPAFPAPPAFPSPPPSVRSVPLFVGHRHHRQPRNADERKGLERRVGLDLRERDGSGELA